MNGVLGGLQIGYNWQTGRYVFGIETDFDATGQRGSQTFNGANGTITLVPAGFGPIAAAPMAAAYTEKLSWLGTFRGRVGIASDRTLFYATGGLAYGEVKSTGSAIISGANTVFGGPTCTATFPAFGTCPLGNWSNSADKTGWTLGGGIEQAFAGSWSVKVEYLYVDLGRVNTTFATSPGCFGGSGGFGCNNMVPGTGTASAGLPITSCGSGSTTNSAAWASSSSVDRTASIFWISGYAKASRLRNTTGEICLPFSTAQSLLYLDHVWSRSPVVRLFRIGAVMWTPILVTAQLKPAERSNEQSRQSAFAFCFGFLRR
jgi:opacity protein-like surface antigen